MMYDDLKKLFDNPVDYSEKFTCEVASISKDIERTFNVDANHDEDMNYSAAQKISLWFDSHGSPCIRGSNLCNFELRFYISSRGNVFCDIYMVKTNESHWQKRHSKLIAPLSVESIRESIESLLVKRGYDKVDDDLLNIDVYDRFNNLDDAPATVFSLLFTELL